MIKKPISLLLLLLFAVHLYAQPLSKAFRRNIALGEATWQLNGQPAYPLNVGIFGNIDRLKGLQLGLLTGTVHQEGRGVNMAGLVALSRQLTGLQLSMVANVSQAQMTGLQLAGITNVARRMKGAQISLFSNVAGADFRGVQVSGVGNVAMGIRRGIQLSSLMNVSQGDMKGLQLAAYNYADTLNGSQLGIINVCVHHPRGVQVGIINISRDTIAHKIGLVNVNPKTRIQMMNYLGTSSVVNTAVRFRNTSTYYVIGLGTHYMGLDKHFSGAFFYRIGQYFPVDRKLSVSGDLGYYHIETFQEDSPGTPERLWSLQCRLNLDYQILPKLGIFASMGYGNTRHYEQARKYKDEFILEGGITVF